MPINGPDGRRSTCSYDPSRGLKVRNQRRHPNQPLVGVGAVIFRGEKMLSVRRGQGPARDTWNLLGGLVEVGETLTSAITRELAEETGLAGAPIWAL